MTTLELCNLEKNSYNVLCKMGAKLLILSPFTFHLGKSYFNPNQASLRSSLSLCNLYLTLTLFIFSLPFLSISYCMRIKLEKVPEGNWMCEECMSSEGIDKHKQSILEPAIGSLNFSNEICRNAGTSSTANIRTCLDLDIEGSNVKKIRRDNVSSVPQFSAKRHAGALDSAVVKKRMVGVESPRFSSNSPHFDGNRANARSPTISNHNSPKFPSHLPMSRGNFLFSQ